jgi:hypothetical protein
LDGGDPAKLPRVGRLPVVSELRWGRTIDGAVASIRRLGLRWQLQLLLRLRRWWRLVVRVRTRPPLGLSAGERLADEVIPAGRPVRRWLVRVPVLLEPPDATRRIAVPTPATFPGHVADSSDGRCPSGFHP